MIGGGDFVTRRSDDPPHEDDDVTVLQDEVGALLDAAGMPQDTVDAVMGLIAAAERRLEAERARPPPWDGLPPNPALSGWHRLDNDDVVRRYYWLAGARLWLAEDAAGWWLDDDRAEAILRDKGIAPEDIAFADLRLAP